jgi:hypothetical protein
MCSPAAIHALVGTVWCLPCFGPFPFSPPSPFTPLLLTQEDPREVEASKYDLNYIGLDGNIGCMGTLSWWIDRCVHLADGPRLSLHPYPHPTPVCCEAY